MALKVVGCRSVDALAMIMLLRGFVDAAMMRAQQAMATDTDPGYLPRHHMANLHQQMSPT